MKKKTLANHRVMALIKDEADLLNYTFTTGEHAGKKYVDVHKNNPEYIEWYLTAPGFFAQHDGVKNFRKHVREHLLIQPLDLTKMEHIEVPKEPTKPKRRTNNVLRKVSNPTSMECINSVADLPKYVFTAGMYEGKTFEGVLEESPRYLLSYLLKETSTVGILNFQKYAYEYLSDDDLIEMYEDRIKSYEERINADKTTIQNILNRD